MSGDSESAWNTQRAGPCMTPVESAATDVATVSLHRERGARGDQQSRTSSDASGAEGCSALKTLCIFSAQTKCFGEDDGRDRRVGGRENELKVVFPPHFFTFFDDKAIRTNKQDIFLHYPLSLSHFVTHRELQEIVRRALSEVTKEKQRKTPALFEKHRSNRAMAEASDNRGAQRLALVASLDDDGAKFSLNDLPNDLLVSIFEAVGDPISVRHTVPLVCKAWDEVYCSQDTTPLNETLEVDFQKEPERAVVEGGAAHPWPRHEGRNTEEDSELFRSPRLEGLLVCIEKGK